MTYLFLGVDVIAKDSKIATLRKQIFSSGQGLDFDYDVWHAHKLEAETLKKSLLNLPAVSKKRLVIIRDSHKLTPQNQDILQAFIVEKSPHADLILDSEEWDQKTAFVKKVARFCEVVEFKSEKKLNVFDMTKAIDYQQDAEALKILDQLLSTGNHPLQIMGGLVWAWGKSRERISPQRFERGLLAMQEADLNIKRSRLKPEYALEMLIVKLCSKEV